MVMHAQILDDRALLALTGADVGEYLQNIVTNDVTALDRGEAVYAALLTPQGIYLFDFLLIPDTERVLVDCLKANKADLIRRLTMYKLRADVQIADISDGMPIAVVWGDDMPNIHGVHTVVDPRLPELGIRLYGRTPEIEAAIPDGDRGDWNTHRLALGVPLAGMDMKPEGCFWLETNAGELHGVDFKKGCYVGQEVVSRMHHKTELRKRFVRVAIEGLAQAGTDIMAGEKVAGTLTSVSGDYGMAYLRLDRAAGNRLTAGMANLTLDPPDWLAL